MHSIRKRGMFCSLRAKQDPLPNASIPEKQRKKGGWVLVLWRRIGVLAVVSRSIVVLVPRRGVVVLMQRK